MWNKKCALKKVIFKQFVCALRFNNNLSAHIQFENIALKNKYGKKRWIQRIFSKHFDLEFYDAHTFKNIRLQFFSGENFKDRKCYVHLSLTFNYTRSMIYVTVFKCVQKKIVMCLNIISDLLLPFPFPINFH